MHPGLAMCSLALHVYSRESNNALPLMKPKSENCLIYLIFCYMHVSCHFCRTSFPCRTSWVNITFPNCRTLTPGSKKPFYQAAFLPKGFSFLTTMIYHGKGLASGRPSSIKLPRVGTLSLSNFSPYKQSPGLDCQPLFGGYRKSDTEIEPDKPSLECICSKSCGSALVTPA